VAPSAEAAPDHCRSLRLSMVCVPVRVRAAG
jgi:hypothetical protein